MPVDTTIFDGMNEQLIRFYEQAEGRLAIAMGRAGVTDFQYRRMQLILDQIDSIVRGLQEKQKGWSQRHLPRAYREGMSLTAESFRMRVLPAMTLMDRRSIETLVMRMTADTAEALGSIAPFAQRVWIDTRQVLVREQQLASEIAAGRIEGLGPRELGRRLKQTFQDAATERLKGFVPEALRVDIQALADGKYIRIMGRDGKYRRYNLRAYSELVANSGTRMAATEGALSATYQAGGDLVQISVHSGACASLCLPVQGKVYSMTGKTPGFPILRDDVRPPLHPHCRHVLIGADEDFLRERGVFGDLQRFSSGDSQAATTQEYGERIGRPFKLPQAVPA